MHEGNLVIEANEWAIVDCALRDLAKRRCALDAEEARLLARAVRVEVWRRFGNVSFHEYLETVLGYTPRQATERVRIATALEDLPEIADALARGELHFSAVRELTRVATRDTERTWFDDVRGKNLRQIEQAVAGRKRGDRPSDPPDPELIATPIRFDVRPATLALLRQAQQVLEAERGERLDDDGLIAALCNAVLGGEETGRAKHQIQTTICESCKQGWQDGAGAKLPLDAADMARAECDAQRIGSDREPGHAVQDVPPRVVRFVHRRDGGHCRVPGCRSSRYLEIHHIVPREVGGNHEPDNLVLLCDGHHRAVHEGTLALSGSATKLETHVGRDRVDTDARLALTTLGFRPSEAGDAIAEARRSLAVSAPLDEVVREALRQLAWPRSNDHRAARAPARLEGRSGFGRDNARSNDHV